MTPLRGGLVGFGFIAEHGHAPAYASRTSPLQITSVAEPCRARHPSIRARFPEARVYADYAELFAREPLDFADICTPPSEHAAIAAAAFGRGLHVLSEKPLALTPLQARGMVDGALSARRVLYPGHSYRHAPVVRTVRDLLQRDLIGAVRMATIDTYRTTHARGAPEWRPDWRIEPRYSGGGILMDHGPHTSYLAFEWMREHPTSVSAWARRERGGDVEDDATVSMVFPNGTVQAHLTWNAGMRRVIYTLHGERGAIRVEDDEVELVVRERGTLRVEKTRSPSEWQDAGHGPWFEGVLSGFTRAIQQGDWVGPETWDALTGIDVIAAAVESAARGGKPVSMPSQQSLVSRHVHADPRPLRTFAQHGDP